MGKIACANVLSDLYAMGVYECDNMLMLLGISSKFTTKQRDTVIPQMIQGFKQCAAEADVAVQGGQTVLNPWCLIGGVATSVCQQNEFIMPNGAEVGDVLVLTKPLGTQVACNLYQWMNEASGPNAEKWSRLDGVVTEKEAVKAYQDAMISMSRLNRTAAHLMHQYNCHAATDVTGFGLLGHADNLCKVQHNEVSFVVHNLPVLNKMVAVEKALGSMFGLVNGTSAETSGGLLLCLPRSEAAKFCSEIKKTEGHNAWIIGSVEKGQKNARIIEKPRIIDVETNSDGLFHTVTPISVVTGSTSSRTQPPSKQAKLTLESELSPQHDFATNAAEENMEQPNPF